MNHPKKRILIADDDRDLVAALAARCRSLGLKVDTATDGLAAINLADQNRPDVVCLDVSMPRGDGLSVCEMIANHDELKHVPTIVLTGSSGEETIRRCHQLCAYYVLKCADVWPRIKPLLVELLHLDAPSERRVPAAEDPVDEIFTILGADQESRCDDRKAPPRLCLNEREQPPWVLCIDDDPDFSKALKLRLEAHGVGVVRAFDGTQGYCTAFTTPADVILLDHHMPNGQGDYVLGRLKDNPITESIPVIVVTGVRDRALERKMINLGAAAYLQKPVDFSVLRAQLERYIPILSSPPELEHGPTLKPAAT